MDEKGEKGRIYIEEERFIAGGPRAVHGSRRLSAHHAVFGGCGYGRDCAGGEQRVRGCGDPVQEQTSGRGGSQQCFKGKRGGRERYDGNGLRK